MALAEKLVRHFRIGDVLVLTGELGSGKTVFVRGLALGLGLSDAKVSSPSFTMVSEYPGETPLYHLDLYRMRDPSELYEIGWDEYLGRQGIVAIEWGEKALGFLPEDHYQVAFRVVSEQEREIQVSHIGG